MVFAELFVLFCAQLHRTYFFLKRQENFPRLRGTYPSHMREMVGCFAKSQLSLSFLPRSGGDGTWSPYVSKLRFSRDTRWHLGVLAQFAQREDELHLHRDQTTGAALRDLHME